MKKTDDRLQCMGPEPGNEIHVVGMPAFSWVILFFVLSSLITYQVEKTAYKTQIETTYI